MNIELSDHTTLYQALLNRDDRYDGQVFVGVSSTGVFCRLTCPARKPKSGNCTFFRTAGECIRAGFRACKRCHPLSSTASDHPVVEALLSVLNEQPDRRWRESDISDFGFDPSTARRVFKKHFNMTFLEMARQRRLRRGFETLAKGGNVIDSQLDAGFESPSAFRAAFSKLLGRAPGDWTSDSTIFVDWIATPLGNMVSATCRSKLHLLEFMDRRALPRELRRLEQFAGGRLGIASTDISRQIKEELAAFFNGKSATFETPLAYHGSEFTRSVWQLLQEIPPGETRTYGEIAETLGRPTASRAVARANGANQIALVIPCHRVIGADGSLTGYGGGLWRKHKLLEIEQSYASTR